MNKFLNSLQEQTFGKAQTENGATMYATTGKDLLDLNFQATSIRLKREEIIPLCDAAYAENHALFWAWLFYLRDARSGIGERDSFRLIFLNRAIKSIHEAKPLVELIAEYGRWDDVVDIAYRSSDICPELSDECIRVIFHQLEEDVKNEEDGQPISLLAKWMPSLNTSSAETRKKSRFLTEKLGVREFIYRKVLSNLRRSCNIVETKMSAKQWSDIDYEKVPSLASLRYAEAFSRNDGERYKEYIEDVKAGKKKINASVLFPHDILRQYSQSTKWGKDDTVEALWNALPDYVNGETSTLVVADVSGSMVTSIRGSSATCWDVSVAMAIYFAQRASGAMNGKIMLFSETPYLIDISGKSLFNAFEYIYNKSEWKNTNVEGVFDAVLISAVKNNLKQEELPKNILLITDMQFDDIKEDYDENLMKAIEKRYLDHGYKLPRLCFWNVCQGETAVPMVNNENGVCLVSGYSPAIAQMVLSNEIDPYKLLLSTLTSERYMPVIEAVGGLYQ